MGSAEPLPALFAPNFLVGSGIDDVNLAFNSRQQSFALAKIVEIDIVVKIDSLSFRLVNPMANILSRSSGRVLLIYDATLHKVQKNALKSQSCCSVRGDTVSRSGASAWGGGGIPNKNRGMTEVAQKFSRTGSLPELTSAPLVICFHVYALDDSRMAVMTVSPKLST
uniref:Uncharacterized protein n=2 Tax=Oryza sativa subsp. japonica TaxID=39947 RepID=Q2R576_ORYSJ|nr:hypothetical protein LOC_Os11g25970 [Oryza sativa Japonica Group]ABA93312.1 hypothetical protein LOC_Os11g25970 [Oryza sativa Japonica Group]